MSGSDNKRLSALITRYWLMVAIALAVGLALVWPEPAAWFSRWHVIDVGVMIVMFLGSLKLAPSRFKEAVTRPTLVIASAISVFVITPILAVGIGAVLGFDTPQDRLAVLICAAQASTLATAIVLTEVAGGDVALAMVMTVVNNLLAVVATPLVFHFLGSTEVQVDHGAMIGEMVLKILLPVLVAQAVRKWIIEWTRRHSRRLSIASQVIILCFIYMGVVAGNEQLLGNSRVLLKVILLALVFHPLVLLINALIARVISRAPGSRAAFVLCSSQKTLPAAILIWKGYFTVLPLGPIVAVAYHVVQLVVDSVLAPGFCRLPLIRNIAASEDRSGSGQSKLRAG